MGTIAMVIAAKPGVDGFLAIAQSVDDDYPAMPGKGVK